MALQISISNAIGARAAAGAGGIDPDAQAFITASGITDATQQSAINQLVVDLKGYNIWSKMKAIYPFVGGSSSSHSYNLRNTAQYQISWSGGVTHNSNGITGSVNGFGNTGIVPSSALTNNSLNVSVYARTDAQVNETQLGCSTSSFLPIIGLSTWNIASQAVFDGYDFSAHRIVSATLTNGKGFYHGNILSSTNQKFYKNGVSIGSTTTAQTQTQPTVQPIYILARNDSGTAANYSARNLAFSSIGDGLTDTEASNFYTAVQAFQVTLGRSIGTQTVSDADAQAFVTNAGIVDQVEANAINNLVIGLKADSLWTKASMIHPYVGGTSTSTSYNLKNTAQFQISWVGGWTWNAQGVKGNGTNSYGNTGFNFSTQITDVNTFSAALYTNQYTAGGVDFGADNNSNWYLAVKSSTFGSNVGAFAAASVGTFTDTTGLGFYTAVKSTNPTPGFSNNVIYKNGVSVNSGSNTTGTLYNGNVYIGGLNRNGSLLLPTNIRYAFSAVFNASLTPTEATNLNNRVTTFQTTLNRL